MCIRDRCHDIAQDFSIAENKHRQREMDRWIDDKDSMLTKKHISPRVGRPGTYKDILTPAQIQRIEDEYNQWMVGHAYL
jgi:hypothetical protein